MFTRLRSTHFKAWKDAGDFPLTLDGEAARGGAIVETDHLRVHEWLRPKWQRMKGGA